MRDTAELKDMWGLAAMISEGQGMKAVNMSGGGGGGGDFHGNWNWSIDFRGYADEEESMLFNRGGGPDWMWQGFGKRVPDAIFERGLHLLEIL